MRVFIRKTYPFFFILFALSATYFSALQIQYLYHDDITTFLRTSHFTLYSLASINNPSGRFLGTLIIDGLSRMVDFVSDLNTVRFISIVQLSLCGFILIYWLKKYLGNTLHALLVAVMILTLPPFEIMASYALICFLPSALLLATLSALCACKLPVTRISKENRRSVLGYSIAAILLLLCALMVYQSAATFYWAVAFLIILSDQQEAEAHRKKRIINLFLIGIISTVFYALFLQLIKHAYESLTVGLYNPFKLTTDYMGKLSWFIRKPLFNSLNLWNIFPQNSYAVATVNFIFLSCLLAVFKISIKRGEFKHKQIAFRQFACAGVIFIGLMLLSFLPNLLAVANFPFYRCSAGVVMMVILVIVWAVNEWVSLLPHVIKKHVLTGVLFMMCLYGMLQASSNVFYYRVFPSYVEFNYLKESLKKTNLNQHQRIHLICPDLSRMKYRYDEFGALTTSFCQSTLNGLGIVTAGFKELYRDRFKLMAVGFNTETCLAEFYFSDYLNDENHYALKIRITSSLPEEEVILDDKTFVIDMTKILNDFGGLAYLKNQTIK